jgi:hypothetical protein
MPCFGSYNQHTSSISYSSSLIKKLLDFLADRLALVVVEAAEVLLHWFRSRFDVQFVIGNLSRDSLHVGGFPCEHVEVCFEEVDERAFLFRTERCPDMKRATIIGDSRILDALAGS